MRERESYISNCVLCLLLLRRPRLASFVLQLCVLLGASCALVSKNQLATFFSSRSVFVYHTHTHAQHTSVRRIREYVSLRFFFCVLRILASEALLRAVCHQAVSKCERNSKCQKVSTDNNNNNNNTAAAQHQYYCNQRGTKRERATKSEHVMLTLLWVRRVAVA